VIKNPVTNHLPPEALKIGLSCKARQVRLKDFVRSLPPRAPVVYLVGGVAKGNPTMEVDYANDHVCLSKFPLSAATCLARLLCEYEALWSVE